MEVSTVFVMKIVERPQSCTIGPLDQTTIRDSAIKVLSTEMGRIFGIIVNEDTSTKEKDASTSRPFRPKWDAFWYHCQRRHVHEGKGIHQPQGPFDLNGTHFGTIVNEDTSTREKGYIKLKVL